MARQSVMACLANWLQRSNLDVDDYEVQGDVVGRRFIIQVVGAPSYAQRRVAQALGALRRADGSWERFRAKDTSNVDQE
eukprot:2160751-Pyramimonas_sp.AAC.1